MIFQFYFLTDTPGVPAQDRCDQCGATMRDITREGRVGCAGCYTHFRAQLMPTLRNLYGEAAHRGRIPRNPKNQGLESERHG